MKRSMLGLVVFFAPGCWLINEVVRPTVVVQAPQPQPATATPPPAQDGQSAPAAAPAPATGAAVFAYSPQLAPFYVSTLFMFAFYPAGMVVAQMDYQPGQYTRWSFPSHHQTSQPSWIERARLQDDPQGNHWWRVKFFDGGSGQTTTLEGLFSPDQARLVRLRAQFPGDAGGNELPVTTQAYFIPPPRGGLTPESLQAATVGTDSITTPAGTFTARHVVFSGGRGSLEWWLADNVPGGTVRQTVHAHGSSGDRDVTFMELQAYGGDAVSELGSK